jgi:hypothetical protein
VESTKDRILHHFSLPSMAMVSDRFQFPYLASGKKTKCSFQLRVALRQLKHCSNYRLPHIKSNDELQVYFLISDVGGSGLVKVIPE